MCAHRTAGESRLPGPRAMLRHALQRLHLQSWLASRPFEGPVLGWFVGHPQIYLRPNARKHLYFTLRAPQVKRASSKLPRLSCIFCLPHLVRRPSWAIRIRHGSIPSKPISILDMVGTPNTARPVAPEPVASSIAARVGPRTLKWPSLLLGGRGNGSGDKGWCE